MKKPIKYRPSSSPIDSPFCIAEVVEVEEDSLPLAVLLENGIPKKSHFLRLSETSFKNHVFAPYDRVLVRIEKNKESSFIGYPVRLLEKLQDIIGTFQEAHGKKRALFFPTDRRLKESYFVSSSDIPSLKSGDLVRATLNRNTTVRIQEILGHTSDPKIFSLIALHQFEIPHHFKDTTLKEAKHVASLSPSKNREDLSHLPLVTIDGEDARDFDDAIWAEKDQDPLNKDGFHLIVAIADVSFYVKPQSFLDHEALERGNSVYFPDRVVPMLPEDLSNDACSLKPGVPRQTLAAHLWIDKSGTLLRSKFTRALIVSAARLTYEEVQSFFNTGKSLKSPELPKEVQKLIPLLYDAHNALTKARLHRGTLDFDLPERSVIFDENHAIDKIIPKARLQSHLLIEEFMIAANVASATFLSKTPLPCMYRIHDKPSLEKIDSLKSVLKPLGISFPSSKNLEPKDLDKILKKSEHLPQRSFIHEIILRCQAQASYSPLNIRHFGLHLPLYAHFTSPIRRYADILVHRALIRALKLGEDGLPDGASLDQFEEIGLHISKTERRAMQAERQTMERYITSYMEDQVHAHFKACISGVHRSGLFIELTETGANGFIPKRLLPYDHYILQEKSFTLQGRNHTFKLGDMVDVILLEANSHTNSLTFKLAEQGKSAFSKKHKHSSSKERKKHQNKKSSA